MASLPELRDHLPANMTIASVVAKTIARPLCCKLSGQAIEMQGHSKSLVITYLHSSHTIFY